MAMQNTKVNFLKDKTNGLQSFEKYVRDLFVFDPGTCSEIKSHNFLLTIKYIDSKQSTTVLDELILAFCLLEKFNSENLVLKNEIETLFHLLKHFRLGKGRYDDIILSLMKLISSFLSENFLLTLPIISFYKTLLEWVDKNRYELFTCNGDGSQTCVICSSEKSDLILKCCEALICSVCYQKTLKKCVFCNFDREQRFEIDLNIFVSKFKELL